MRSTIISQKTFYWKGVNTLGKKVHGKIEAMNKTTAMSQLDSQSIFFIKIYSSHRIFSLNSSKVPPLLLVFFFRQLATLITSGIPIVDSLVLLSQMNNHIIFQKMLSSIKNNLESGKLLSFSLQQFPQYFDHITCHLIRVGEQSGTLSLVLEKIAAHKENVLYLKKKIIQSLIYPSIILSIAFIITGIMLIFVVPRFSQLFQTMHGHLPTLTLFVIQLSHWIRPLSLILFIFIILILLGFNHVKQLPAIKKQFDTFLLKIPWVGKILSKIILARFTRYLTMTLHAGIPITQSLKMMIDIIGNVFYKNAISDLHSNISKGKSLYQSIQTQNIFPKMMIQMIKIGEESGTLEKMLEKISEIYESDIEHLITQLTQTLEPLIMIILGVLIGGLVIAMYLPIFKLGTLM